MIEMSKEETSDREQLSPIEKELLELVEKSENKYMTFSEISAINPRFMGALGKLISRRFAKVVKDIKRPKKDRKLLALKDVDVQTILLKETPVVEEEPILVED